MMTLLGKTLEILPTDVMADLAGMGASTESTTGQAPAKLCCDGHIPIGLQLCSKHVGDASIATHAFYMPGQQLIAQLKLFEENDMHGELDWL